MEQIKTIKFSNYKSLTNFSINFRDANIMIGPNNCGKSTIIGAFRLLDLGLKKARSKKPDFVLGIDEKYFYGFYLDESEASISLENVSTDYNELPSSIIFEISNNNKLILYFPRRNECAFYWENIGKKVDSPTKFKMEFPINILVIPVLGPFEHDETILTQETIRKGMTSHRSSRHFRNYWYNKSEGWDQYRMLIEKTWPGMSIKPPELIDGSLKMFCSENRIDRELFWSGFGFQIWCQLLSHICRANENSIVVIDEPEIYLHPDVQRQLLGILKDIKCCFIVATHSVEIISEADATDILMIDKMNKNAIRLRDISSVQKAIEIIGSTHNITLAQLARTRRMIFTEGHFDWKILKSIARQLGYSEIASGSDLTWFESGGFSSWETIKAFSKMVESTIDERLAICTIYDKDYYCDEELENIKTELEKSGVIVIFHKVKEIENYLIEPKNIAKAYHKIKADIEFPYIEKIVIDLTESIKIETQAQFIAKRCDFYKKRYKDDTSTISADALKIFEEKWNKLDERLKIVPGKIILQRIREKVQCDYSCTISDSKLVESINKTNISKELLDIVNKIEEFRQLKL